MKEKHLEDLLEEIPVLLAQVYELTAKVNVVADRAVAVAEQAATKYQEQTDDKR